MFYFPLDSGNIAYQSRFSTNAQTDIVRYTISSFGKPARFMVNGKVDLLNRNVDPSEISVCIIDKHSNDTLATKALNEDGSFRQKLAGGSYTLNFSDHTQLLLSREMNIPEYFPHDNLVIYEEITVPYAVIAEDTLIIRDIRFGFNTSDLDTTYLPDLRKLAGIMEKYPGISIEVNGYADALGSSNYNLKLSRHRGNSVKAFLESRFNIQDRIVVNAYGEDNPVAMNTHADGRDHPEGRYYNRRAEIILVNSPDPLSVIHINNIPETVKLK
jgi:outer membrane protein OmpA-like peptidoglycan-associated protein